MNKRLLGGIAALGLSVAVMTGCTSEMDTNTDNTGRSYDAPSSSGSSGSSSSKSDAYLDDASAIASDASDTMYALASLSSDASSDTSLVYTASWKADVRSTASDLDALYRRAKALNPPASMAAMNTSFVEGLSLAAEAGDEMVAFCSDYDVNHLFTAASLMNEGTAKINEAAAALK